jgi:hypothetical protein
MGTDPGDGFRFYGKESAWWNMLWAGGYEFLNPPPMITKEGIKPFPNRGARKLNARTSFFYTATGITPAMCMRLEGIGSQYLVANIDKNGEPFDGSKTYKVVLPKDIPAARFWSFTVYDNQTRSMLQTPQVYPRAGSQSYPTPAAVRWYNNSLLQPQTASGRRKRELDPDGSGQRLVHHPAPLQSVAVFLR